MCVFKKVSLDKTARSELHDILGLSGCEISVNRCDKGQGVPFVHSHDQNEEVYGILEGRGELYIDGSVHAVKAGDWFLISPAGKRALKADDDSSMVYICIQTKENSLEKFTMGDGQICEEKAPWQN